MKLKSKIKKFILKITGNVKHLKKTINCSSLWYGNTYRGFYIFPDLLDEKSVIYSFGIGQDISFDSEIIKNHNCHVFGFDPTPKSINWIKAQKLHEKFNFHEFGISNISGYVDFYLPKNHDYVSGSLVKQKNIDATNNVRVEMKSIKDIMSELDHKHIDVLKMDIEGSEYAVIKDILASNVSITQILIEFHDRFFEDGRLRTKQAIQELKRHGYEIYATSDSYEEISFIKKNAIENIKI